MEQFFISAKDQVTTVLNTAKTAAVVIFLCGFVAGCVFS